MAEATATFAKPEATQAIVATVVKMAQAKQAKLSKPASEGLLS